MKRFSYSISAIASIYIGLFSTFACSTDEGDGDGYVPPPSTGGTTALGSGGAIGSGGATTGRGGTTSNLGGANNSGGANASVGGGSNGGAGTVGGSSNSGGSTAGGAANGGSAVGGTSVGGAAAGNAAVGGASAGNSAVGGAGVAGAGVGGADIAGAAGTGVGGSAGTSNSGGSAGTTDATGGTSSAGAPTTGGAATGGAATGGAATGGAATGGAATGGAATGGAATGGAATGGAATGGSGGLPACTASTPKASFCRPNSDTITGLMGSFNVNGITFTASGSSIAVTSANPVTSGTSLTGLSPYNEGTCSGQGVNASSVATSQPYTGMSLLITNSSSAPVTIAIYIDSITSGGQLVQRKYSFPQIAADNQARTYNLTWASTYTDSCMLPGGSTFDQTKINGIGFGVETTTPSVQLDLTMANISFTGGGTASPCSGICSNPTVLTGTISRNNMGTGALCFETTNNFTQGNCGGFTSPRTFSINGTAVNCSSGNFSAPAKVNGGYCFSAPAGNESWAYFGVW